MGLVRKALYTTAGTIVLAGITYGVARDGAGRTALNLMALGGLTSLAYCEIKGRNEMEEFREANAELKNAIEEARASHPEHARFFNRLERDLRKL